MPGRYRLWAFADLNRNRSFEPPTDVLDAIDTVFSLTREQPAATGSRSVVLNPHAPGRVRGTVLDSLRVTTGKLLVLAMSVPDSSAKVGGSVNERFESGPGRFNDVDAIEKMQFPDQILPANDAARQAQDAAQRASEAEAGLAGAQTRANFGLGLGMLSATLAMGALVMIGRRGK